MSCSRGFRLQLIAFLYVIVLLAVFQPRGFVRFISSANRSRRPVCALTWSRL
jgi:hypothetical protein